MNLFGNRKERGEAAPASTEISALRAEIERLDAALRSLRVEWAETHDRLYRFMKRAEVAARKVDAAAAAEVAAEPLRVVDTETPLRLPGARLWGARARRAQRQARAANSAAEPNEGE